MSKVQLNISVPLADREAIGARARELGFRSVADFVLAAIADFADPRTVSARVEETERRLDRLEQIAGLGAS